MQSNNEQTYMSIEERFRYSSIISPSVNITKQFSNTKLNGVITISAKTFDIRTCDFDNIFVINNNPLDKKINWGKAILYNYVGIKLEKASTPGEYSVDSHVDWEDITNSSIDFQKVQANQYINPNKNHICSNYMIEVARYGLNNYYKEYLPSEQCYNYQYALNFNKYMDISNGNLGFDVNQLLQSIKEENNDDLINQYVYGSPSSYIETLTFNLNYLINHQLSATPQTYRLSVSNPSTPETKFVCCIYHKSNDKYYTYVEDSLENNENGENLLYYNVDNTIKNTIKLSMNSFDNFQSATSTIKLRLKKNIAVSDQNNISKT